MVMDLRATTLQPTDVAHHGDDDRFTGIEDVFRLDSPLVESFRVVALQANHRLAALGDPHSGYRSCIELHLGVEEAPVEFACSVEMVVTRSDCFDVPRGHGSRSIADTGARLGDPLSAALSVASLTTT